MKEMQASGEPSLSFYARLKSVANTAKTELYGSKLYQKALLGSTVCLLAFEWGPGNEWLIGSVGAETHNNFNPADNLELLQASIITGVAAGTVSAVEQSAIGLGTAGSIRAFPQTFSRWDSTKQLKSATNDNKGDIITGIALGTSAVVVEKNLQNPKRQLKDDVKITIKTAGQIGLFNTALVSGLSTSGYLLDNAGQDQLANNIESLAKNPLTYLSIFGLIKAIDYIKYRKKIRNSDN